MRKRARRPSIAARLDAIEASVLDMSQHERDACYTAIAVEKKLDAVAASVASRLARVEDTARMRDDELRKALAAIRRRFPLGDIAVRGCGAPPEEALLSMALMLGTHRLLVTLHPDDARNLILSLGTRCRFVSRNFEGELPVHQETFGAIDGKTLCRIDYEQELGIFTARKRTEKMGAVNTDVLGDDVWKGSF